MNCILENGNTFSIEGLNSPQDNIFLINEMRTSIYKDRLPNPKRDMQIFSMDMARQFINETADKILEYI